MHIGFWGSSLASAYWNGAATYYRGILRAMKNRGHRVTFFEPDAYGRQEHRDIENLEWAHIVVYDPQDHAQLAGLLSGLTKCDVVVKASGVGVLDEFLETRIAGLPDTICKVFWDVDAPATLARLAVNVCDSLRVLLPKFDMVLAYGGGERVINEYRAFGARECVIIYNALDTTVHFPVPSESRYSADLSFLGNRLPDREARVNEFFLRAATLSPRRRFLLGGAGWEDKPLPANVVYVGHVYTADHNALNCSAKLVLNVSRESMASYGFSPATRVFEAAGAGACIITDNWEGIEYFLKPGNEILVAATGADVARFLAEIEPERARTIGDGARKRVLAEHTYQQRAHLLEETLLNALAQKFHEQGSHRCETAIA